MPNCSGLKVIIANTNNYICCIWTHKILIYATKKNKQKTASVYIVILLFEINITFEKLKYTPLEWCYSDKWREFCNKRLIPGIDNCMY